MINSFGECYMVRNLCVLYKRKYSGESMLYSACYGGRKRR